LWLRFAVFGSWLSDVWFGACGFGSASTLTKHSLLLHSSGVPEVAPYEPEPDVSVASPMMMSDGKSSAGSIPSPAQSWTQAPGDQKNEESATSADSVPQ